MQKSFSPHTQFFTSLKHLEKRLKLENPQAPPPSPPVEHEAPINDTQQTDSLGTPIYLCNTSASINSNASNIQESEAPQEFLSPPNHDGAEAIGMADRPERVDLGDDDIGVLMQLLRLSHSEEMNQKAGNDEDDDDDDFYERIVGVKGPKNVKEKERMEGWIKHFFKGERKEPFRLVHLLLGKAAFLHSDDGFGGLVYPSTINHFLQVDPPIE